MPQDTPKNQPTISEQRRERERAELMARIMDVARDMFVRDGYEAVTLRKIAKAIEYSPAAIYQYFKDKQALVMAIIRADSQDLRGHLVECMRLEDPLDQVAEMARRYANWGIAHPNHYRLLLDPPPAWAEQDRELREYERPPLEQEALFVLRGAVEEAIRRGMFRDEFNDPALIAATLWAGIHGVVLLEITMTPKDRSLLGVERTAFTARLDMLKKVLLKGFLKEWD